MLTIDENRIYLTRGDTAEIAVSLKKLDDTDYEMQTGDVLYFRMKKYATKDPSEILIEKTADVLNNEISFTIEPYDTESLAFGEYSYEVELVTGAEEQHYTVIADSEFVIGKEIENHG